jgi:hypothetical protein
VKLLAIDPGPEESAYCVYSGAGKSVEFAKVTNNELSFIIDNMPVDAIVIEKVCSYGMAVGEEVFQTVFWSGRFWEAAMRLDPGTTFRRMSGRLPRLAVKLHLCKDSKAKDGNIRQALIDRYGGKDTAIGAKKNPGPLYGMAGDCWAALAVAVTWWETELERWPQ